MTGYLTHLGLLDVFIILLGLSIGIFAIHGTWHLGRQGNALSPKERVLLQARWASLLRTLSVLTDILPLLGLLGTAFAILNTFLGLGGSINSADIIANFAPGLTTTISGIGFAIINTIIIQTGLSPAFEKRFSN